MEFGLNKAIEHSFVIHAQRTFRLHSQLNSVVYGEAYGRAISVSGRQHRQGRAEVLELRPLCVTSRWLTSLGRKPGRAPYMPYYVKTQRHPQNRKKYITYCTVVWGRSEPRPQVTCAENFVKFRRVVLFAICERTDRHTDTLIAILRTPRGSEVINQLLSVPDRAVGRVCTPSCVTLKACLYHVWHLVSLCPKIFSISISNTC